MNKKVEALVNPELLRWARESARLSLEITAKKAHIKLEQLESWESGKSRPSIPQLRKLAEIYKRPLSVFYLPKPPKTFDALHDYRRLPDQTIPEISPPLAYEIRRARERREIALELYELLGEEPPQISIEISLDDDPENLSLKIRNFLGVTIEKQVQWKSNDEAYNTWRKHFESHGILTFETSDRKINITEMRGFSISEKPLPVIVINKKDARGPRIFSLMHELAHVLLGKEGICEFDSINNIGQDDWKVEVFCNHVAGAVLVPKDDFLYQLSTRRIYPRDNIEDDNISALSRRYKVSKEVILRRLLTFKYISKTFYEKYKSIYDNEARKIALKKGEETAYVPVYLKTLSINGRSFTQLILYSYHQEKITLSDVSDYLRIKLKHLSKIEAEMAKRFSFA